MTFEACQGSRKSAVRSAGSLVPSPWARSERVPSCASTLGKVCYCSRFVARFLPPPDQAGHGGDDENDSHGDEALHARIVGSPAGQ